MNGYETCRLFQALNNHFFQPNYDYFLYHGGVPLKAATYEKKRPDEKHRYDRLGRKFQTKEELENFLVATIISSSRRLWIGHYFGGEADETYLRWQGRTQSLQYSMLSEVKRIVDRLNSFNALFTVGANEHPEILKSHIRGDISLESFVLLDMVTGFIAKVDAKIQDDRNWSIVKIKAEKYRPFIERMNIDVPAYRKALLESIQRLGISS